MGNLGEEGADSSVFPTLPIGFSPCELFQQRDWAPWGVAPLGVPVKKLLITTCQGFSLGFGLQHVLWILCMETLRPKIGLFY